MKISEFIDLVKVLYSIRVAVHREKEELVRERDTWILSAPNPSQEEVIDPDSNPVFLKKASILRNIIQKNNLDIGRTYSIANGPATREDLERFVNDAYRSSEVQLESYRKNEKFQSL